MLIPNSLTIPSPPSFPPDNHTWNSALCSVATCMGENGCMYMMAGSLSYPPEHVNWVNYCNIVNWLYSNIK